MWFSTLGSSDLRVSAVALGCNNLGWSLDYERSRAIVDAALSAGITFFDTADVYGQQGRSEEFLGRSLRGRRQEAVIATKFGYRPEGEAPGDALPGSRAYIRQALAASLTRLRTDYVDLYYIHVPQPAPLEETLAALDELRREGTIRAFGCSNFEPELLRAVDEICRRNGYAHPAAAQDHYNLLERDVKEASLAASRELGLGFIPYWPLANGLLTGKYRRGEAPPPGSRLASWQTQSRAFYREVAARTLRDEVFDRLDRLNEFAREHERTLLELAVGGLLSVPGVSSVIGGATTPEQVRANAAAAAWQLTPEQLEQLDSIL